LSPTALRRFACWRSRMLGKGLSRAEAARLAGMERQAIREAVIRYNAEGPEGLHDQPALGPAGGLTDGQQAALKAWVLPTLPCLQRGDLRRRLDPVRDGIGAWRLVDIGDHAEQAYGVRTSEGGMSRLLKRLGLSRQKARPQHPQSSPAAQAAFKKGAWRKARGHRRDASASRDPALV
jgi:transposase